MDVIVEQLKTLLPVDRVTTQADQLEVAARDESTLPGVTPLAVCWPMKTGEIAEIVRLCFNKGVPITTRGGGSALEGSAIPSEGAIVVDLSRMTRIINFWPDDLQVEVEPGIIYDDLNEQIKREGLFFPPSPGGSGDLATIGGMVSTNASGIYSVKYGGTREYVLALEIVTGTGEILRIGNRAIKRSSGYNLVELVAGAEGTLAIIGSVTIRLAGIPEGRLKTAYKFPSEKAAATAVSEMRKYGLDIAAIEFLDRRLMTALNKLKGYGLEEVPALFLEFHGPGAVLESNSDLAGTICTELDAEKLELAEGHNPWEIRHFATDAIKHYKPGYSILRNDVAFPISRLAEMVEYCHQLADEHEITMFTFGHVGMGLLHALMLARKDIHKEWRTAVEINNEIIARTIEVGGTISGEHGIGLGHKDMFDQEHGAAVEYMRKIKKQFDPQNILNPGKIFDI
jgi:D-lactate dehydrogenase (cytochrome)